MEIQLKVVSCCKFYIYTNPLNSKFHHDSRYAYKPIIEFDFER